MDLYLEVRNFFHEKLRLALESLAIKAQGPTEFYLVDLLTAFAATERVQDLQTPFVELLSRAYASRGSERAIRMQVIGDSALFVSGFLPDSMERRGISRTYCVSIGQRAYGEAGQRIEAGSDATVFHDLAGHFPIYLRVLDEVREQTSHRTDDDLLRLYDRWMGSDSPELLRRLGRHGINIMSGRVYA